MPPRSRRSIFSPITFSNWEKLLSGPFPGSLVSSAIITVGTAWPRWARRAGGLRLRARTVPRPAFPGRLAPVQPDDAAGHLHHPAVPVLPPAPPREHVPGPHPRVHDGPAAVHGLDVGLLLRRTSPSRSRRRPGSTARRASVPSSSCCRWRCRACSPWACSSPSPPGASTSSRSSWRGPGPPRRPWASSTSSARPSSTGARWRRRR